MQFKTKSEMVFSLFVLRTYNILKKNRHPHRPKKQCLSAREDKLI